jgi:hypothetical protein
MRIADQSDVQDNAEWLAPSLGMIMELQTELAKMPQAEMPLKHHFSPGVYAREILIPAGTTAVSKIAAMECLLILAKGDLSLTTSEGTERFHAPWVLKTPPGVKRIMHTHEDTTLISIHATNETDLAKIEAEVIMPEQADASRQGMQ